MQILSFLLLLSTKKLSSHPNQSNMTIPTNISKYSKITLAIFIIVSIMDMYGVITQDINIRYIFKPLVISSLLAYYLISSTKKNITYIIALLLCLTGDIFLMFRGSLNFILGLVSFLTAHILYIAILIKLSGQWNRNKLIKSIIPFSLVFIVLISILFKNLGTMLAPVIFYGLTICTMGTLSLYFYLKSNSRASLIFLLGSCFFILSDSLLAINKFLTSQYIFGILVMSTYIIAQYLICKSMLYLSKESKS